MHLVNATAASPQFSNAAPSTGHVDTFSHSMGMLREDLFRRALFLSEDRALANDLAQDTIARALSARAQFVKGTNMRAWAMSILRNAFIDECRHQSHLVREDLQLPSIPADKDIGPLDILSTDDVETALASLSSLNRQIFKLAHIERMPHRNIASSVGLHVATVGSRLFRVRKYLRRTLERIYRSRLAETSRCGRSDAR